jgi:hypothetical protein
MPGESPAPDFSAADWEYWCKTELAPRTGNVRGDGVLRLRKAIFVRIAWDTISGIDRCTLTQDDKISRTAHLEFSSPITTLDELSRFISRWIPQIEMEIFGQS